LFVNICELTYFTYNFSQLRVTLKRVLRETNI
jgi:hypothetical protein